MKHVVKKMYADLRTWFTAQPGFHTLKQQATWARIEKVHQLKVVQTMYVWLFIVPIAVTSLQNIENVVNITLFGHSFDLVTSLPFSWLAFYGSALCFVLGNVFFFSFSPRLIREHPSPSTFFQEGKGLQHLSAYAKEANLEWRAICDAAEVPAEIEEHELSKKEMETLFWKAYDAANEMLPSGRLITGIFYGMGVFWVAFVVFENTVKVFEFATRP